MRMRGKLHSMKRFFIGILAFVTSSVFSQEVHHFDRGLLVTAAGRYGREAISTDQVAYRLYTHNLQTPVEGDSFLIDQKGTILKWQAVTADSLNRLRGRGGFGGAGGGELRDTFILPITLPELKMHC